MKGQFYIHSQIGRIYPSRSGRTEVRRGGQFAGQPRREQNANPALASAGFVNPSFTVVGVFFAAHSGQILGMRHRRARSPAWRHNRAIRGEKIRLRRQAR